MCHGLYGKSVEVGYPKDNLSFLHVSLEGGHIDQRNTSSADVPLCLW